MQFLRPGDTLIVTRIDLRDLQNIVRELREKGVHLKATGQPIDTSSAAGKAFSLMLGVFAEFENNLRRERQMEGINAAKARGVYKGPQADDQTGRCTASAQGGPGRDGHRQEARGRSCECVPRRQELTRSDCGHTLWVDSLSAGSR